MTELGLDIFTLSHTGISLIAIALGFWFLKLLLQKRNCPRLTAGFLGLTALISVTAAHGSLLYTSAGLAGELSGVVATNIPGVTFAGTLGVAINTIGAPVNSVIAVGSETVTLDLPAGPFVRLSVTEVPGATDLDPSTPATLTVGGQILSGSFALEQITSIATGGKVIRLVATGVELHLRAGATEIVSLTEGEGALVITAAGLAGRVSGNVQIGNIAGGATFSGRFSLAINNTRSAVVEQLNVGSTTRVRKMTEYGAVRPLQVHLTGLNGPVRRPSADPRRILVDE